jgi:hypothetical protein
MAFYLSPLVDVNEIDLSTTVPAVATTIGAIVLRNTYKGPERKKWLITTVNDLINTFGKPTSTAACYEDILSATGFLKYGNALYCTRTMPASSTFAGTRATSGSSVTFVPFGAAYKLSDFVSEDPDNFNDDIPASTIYPFYLIASSRGAWGNNVRVAVIDKTTQAEILSGGHSGWSTYTDLASVDSPLLDNKSFLIVVSVKGQGETTYQVKEYWNVSTDENILDDQGRKLFAPYVINAQSNYIRISMNPLAVNGSIIISTENYQSFTLGVDSAGGPDTVTDALVIADYDLYANAEEIDVNMLIDSDKNLAVKQELVTICESRKDCMAILDAQYADCVNNVGTEATDITTWRRDTLNENTSYASLYGNWLEVYDKWNAKYRWVPASGFVAGIYVNTDDVSDPWFAPAGFNRAVLSNVRRLGWNPDLGERNTLYKNGVNPVVSFAGQGKVVWGQKTLLDKESAFNRINVRRLFIVLEKAISTAAKYFLFEPNDDLTRLLLVNMIDPFLRDVRSRRGIYDYMVVCDETNNTAERIDRNELWCDIYIKPTRAAEFIVLNFIATKTGASFTELAGATSGA